MIYSTRFNVILDACVLYPAPVRDILLNLAEQELYSPKWSETIQEEWVRNLLLNRPDLTKPKLIRTVKAMNGAFPDALVHSFEKIIDSIELPDPDDRHVVAAAIRCNAHAILTFNKKDFPPEYLRKINIEVYIPDTFICILHDLYEASVNQAFNNQLASLKNPPKTKEELIHTLEKCGLIESVKLFH
ncbi:MAG TPA: PIN domain-containing protein [Bacteroidetes bacterium]|nr:PIN domain-containing protein [Bacteroidota bacterium]